MARGTGKDESVEFDRVEGLAHPRETFDLVGQEAALEIAARAVRSGRPPQGWLISGAPGIGKATLAYRIARYLLKYGATNGGPTDLSVPPDDTVSQQVEAGAHPGLLVLKRGLNPDTGKPMSVLSVAEIRRLGNFFGLTSGAGGWRVVIIDTADDMNDAAANALLKALEEPPPRAMLLLLSNAPGRLLPTTRSRCQRLSLRSLDPIRLADELAVRLPELSDESRLALARLSGGALGMALALAGGDSVMLADEAERLIEHADSPDLLALLSLAERLAKIKDGPAQFGEALVLALGERIRARARNDGPHLMRWLQAWEALRGAFARSDALHLEPRQTILSAAQTLRQAARFGHL